MAEARSKKPVMIFYKEEYRLLDCDEDMTIADVKNQWLDAIESNISVAFLTQDDQYMPETLTVAEALANSSGRTLELHAFLKSSYQLQVFGFDETRAEFEVAGVLAPAAVRREIGTALDIYTDDFRLIWNDVELDQELPFKQQEFPQGALLTVDLRVIVKVNFDDSGETRNVECFSSECIADLRQKLDVNDDTALVATSPYFHFLADPLRVCYIVNDVMDLQIPIEVTAEKKVMLAFEPMKLEHLRQKLPISLSCTPIDLYDLVSKRFQLTTEHRLAIHGKELDNCEPLRNQLIDADDVIQVDILRPCEVFDLWEDPFDVNAYEEVYLYSTESAYALYLRDELSDQRLYHQDINLTIFGAMIDIFGAISGQHKPVLVVDRDVERSLPMLTFDGVVQRLAWARSMLLDVVPTSGGLLPNEIMYRSHLLPAKSTFIELRMTENTLMVMEPEKIFVSSDKKLRICRVAHDGTYGDIRKQMQQLKRSLDIGLKTRNWEIPDNAMNRKLERELLFLTSASRFQTKLTVTMNKQWYGCWFEPQQVSFSDVMINIGKQTKVMPRHLFQRSLYCCGCGRHLSAKEEPHQAIPAPCCSVRSLQLTDRRVRDIGIQAGGARKRDVVTYTLDPESRDVCVGTDSVRGRTVVGISRGFERSVSAHPPLPSLPPPPPTPPHPRSISMLISVQAPTGEEEQNIESVNGVNCGDLLETVRRKFLRFSVEDSPTISTQEVIYYRDGKKRRGYECADRRTGGYSCIDSLDGKKIDDPSPQIISRFLRHSSPLPSPPSLLPFIIIQTETEYHTVTSDRNLQPAPASAFTDPSFVVALPGIISGRKLFWYLYYGRFRYVDAESGRAFAMEEIRKGQKRFFYALLRDKDPVPHIKVPIYEILHVHQRIGFEMKMTDGRVHCTRTPKEVDVELWGGSKTNDTFATDFSNAARKK